MFLQSIKKVSTVCTSTDTFRRMIMLLPDLDKMMITSLKDLNQKKVKQVTSPTVLLTKTIAAQNEVLLSYHVHRLCFLAVVFVGTILHVT